MTETLTTSTTWLLINSASGSNDDQAVARVVDGLAAAGRSPVEVVSAPQCEPPSRADLEAAGADLLVIFTGDGTVNWAVCRLYGWGGKVLVLPGGTQNLLARSLHGESGLEHILDRLAQGALVQERRHLIRTSQGDGLCEVVAGPGATWSDVREALRDGDMGELATQTAEALERSMAGPPVRITEPGAGKPQGYPAVRLYPVGAQMRIAGYGAEGWAELAQQGLALLMRNFRDGPHDDLPPAGSVVLESDDPIELMVDGERKTGDLRERFTLSPCEVTFLATPVAERPDA